MWSSYWLQSLFIAPLVTPTDDTDDINITILDELINTTTTSVLRLYQPCGSPELLKGIVIVVYRIAGKFRGLKFLRLIKFCFKRKFS